MFQSGLNNISFEFPPFSLLTQSDEISDGVFCNETNKPKHCDGLSSCHCTQLLSIALDSVVEFVLVDENRVLTSMTHPFHMHGYGLTLTDMVQGKDKGMTVDLYKELERKGKVGNVSGQHIPPIKDTITIPSLGYVKLRFRATNPGFWLLHCHIEHHFAVGMILLVQVGDTKDFPKTPENFPKCHNFVPDVYENLSANEEIENSYKIVNQ